jgi:putative protein-disulfide isomerase
MDPYCGWCYGNHKNIIALHDELKARIEFDLLLGGMYVGGNVPNGGEDRFAFVKEHSPRLERFSGQKIGESYLKLIKDEKYTLNSLTPSNAIRWVRNRFPKKVFEFAGAVQSTLFLGGKSLSNEETYKEIFLKFSWMEAWDEFLSEWQSDENIYETKQDFLLAGSLAKGFPALVYEQEGSFQMLASGFRTLEDYRKIFNL